MKPVLMATKPGADHVDPRTNFWGALGSRVKELKCCRAKRHLERRGPHEECGHSHFGVLCEHIANTAHHLELHWLADFGGDAYRELLYYQLVHIDKASVADLRALRGQVDAFQATAQIEYNKVARISFKTWIAESIRNGGGALHRFLAMEEQPVQGDDLVDTEGNPIVDPQDIMQSYLDGVEPVLEASGVPCS